MKRLTILAIIAILAGFTTISLGPVQADDDVIYSNDFETSFGREWTSTDLGPALSTIPTGWGLPTTSQRHHHHQHHHHHR